MKLQQVPLEQINAFRKNTLMEALDIRCIELGDDYLVATMPVDHRT
ncbi:MAG: phenylacetic acid degradation protein, partial [Flavobacteriia bacterium]|nr:phenylacetic acid degradation protein [Flavobacteriia bacterium]